jgi:DNA-directed RNA polymerase subunit RPC12/RpoP
MIQADQTRVEEFGEYKLCEVFYKCLNCRENRIIRDFDYCPHCGRKIIWEEKTDE